MKKIMNEASHFVTDVLEGIYLAHPGQVTCAANDLHCFVKKNTIKGKVGIITGGGSGHLPLFLGYVGDGMLDGCAVGNVFQSPNPEQILEVTRAADSGAGVIYVFGNYNGDIFNFDIAAGLAEMDEGIRTQTVIVADDVASAAPDGGRNTRRGIAGIFFVYKCMGAAAAQMKSLDEVKALGEKVCANVRTMGVATGPCIVPELGRPSFTLADDEMEIGMGIHGEPGIERGGLLTAREIARKITLPLIEDMELTAGDRVSVLVNGLGATPLEEQYILYGSVHAILREHGITPGRVFAGEFATSMEMAGLSVSLLKLDDELEPLLEAPANAVLYQQV